jgi:hypothetical protein
MMKMHRTLALAAAGAGLAAGLMACGSPAPPSAQCRAQFQQVGAYLASAKALTNSSVASFNGSIGTFNQDVNEARRLLNVMKSEGCPEGGY